MGFEGATALDLFSGTGSITLELLSRGCAHVISIEADRDHHRFIMQCLQKLKDTSVDSGQWTVDRYDHNCHCLPIRGDVFRFVKSCKQQFDLIFADPPYALKELPTIPSLIFEKNLLKPEGVFVFEHGKDHDFRDHPNFVEHRSYGSVNFSIFRPLHQR